MIKPSRGVLLTGATGLLGRYLLRDLLLAGERVAVLVRNSRKATATDRIAEIIAFWSEELGKKLDNPLVLVGDLRVPGLGLTAGDRRWLAGWCGSIVHAAANLSFRPTPDGEPWKTNVIGTRHLLEFATKLRPISFHHVSSAFVCGQARAAVYENDLDRGQAFNNIYEQSKFEAERLVRQDTNLRATVYRPSVIVGDSRTGFTTSYHGIYRFLELGTRLAEPVAGLPARKRLRLRLPLTGAEPRNLVPVDWVADAIVEMMNRSACHGQTLHLVSTSPVATQWIKQVAEELLGVEGVEFAGPDSLAALGPQERMFLDKLEEYWPYLQGDPTFDCRNSAAAMPTRPPVAIDRPFLERLIRFAVADDWGRRRRRGNPPSSTGIDCAHYVEEFFAAAAQHSPLAHAAGLNLTIGLEVRGPGGGQWSCGWVDGNLAFVRRVLAADATVIYHTDTATFADVIAGRQSPPDAFFAQRIDVSGDVEAALKLAVLFGQFLKECPYLGRSQAEATNALAT